MAEQIDLIDDFDVSGIEQSFMSQSRFMLQKSGLIAKLGPTTFTLYSLIRSFCNARYGLSFAGNELLGSIMNRKHDTIGRAIDDLCKEKLVYVDVPAGGPKTRGLRVIDWIPAHVRNEDGALVRGWLCVPYIPSVHVDIMRLGIVACAAQFPDMTLRTLLPAGHEGYHFMREAINGEWVFAICPGREKLSRNFFINVGMSVESVGRFYAQKREIDATDAAKRRAAVVAASDSETNPWPDDQLPFV